ncbi:hypothetical protein PUN28_015835 [Cardiocondyla obscurior]|uniref:WD repeat-containing protein 74 n=2 Tax=Cardiocondyla obscurior TaxID=286306 RepID=A0AAW2EPH6_9HYME
MSDRATFDVFAGATSGVVKGIKIGETKKETRIKNLQELAGIKEDDRVTRIAWGDDDEREILVACGKKDRRIKIYDSDSGIRTQSFLCNIGEGSINGVSKYNECILTSVGSGIVSLWSSAAKQGVELVNAGENLNRMCHSHVRKNVIATGGKENKVKMYDLEKREMIFLEKNLPHDWLNLRRPIWISDLNFLPETQQIIAVGRYGNIYLYDPSSQRRPVLHMTVQNEAWTCLAIPPKEKHIIVGSTTGKLNLIDLRKSGKVLNTYKGFVGGVTGVTCSKTNPYVASVSLDRHLRIHDINTKEMLKCIYLTSRLSCLVIRSDISLLKEEKFE